MKVFLHHASNWTQEQYCIWGHDVDKNCAKTLFTWRQKWWPKIKILSKCQRLTTQ